MSQLKVMYAFF